MHRQMKNNMEIFHRIKAYFFDLDGCIFFGNVIAPGALEIVRHLQRAGKRVCFVTNNSRQSTADIAVKLHGMGLEVSEAEILSATDYVGRYLRNRYGCSTVKVAGSPELCNALTVFGHRVVPYDDKTDVDVVVVGLDTEFTYDKLKQLTKAIEGGARLIAANADLSHPGQDGGKVPETGALIAAIEAVTGKCAEYVGKPEPHLFLYGMKACGVRPENSVMIGDNYNTDIVGGKGIGMFTVWLSGLAAFERKKLAIDKSAADWIVNHLPELNRRMGGLGL